MTEISEPGISKGRIGTLGSEFSGRMQNCLFLGIQDSLGDCGLEGGGSMGQWDNLCHVLAKNYSWVEYSERQKKRRFDWEGNQCVGFSLDFYD